MTAREQRAADHSARLAGPERSGGIAVRENNADMINYLGQDTLEFSHLGKSLGKAKIPNAGQLFQRITSASEASRAKMIRDAATRHLNTSPAGESAGFDRKKP